TIADHVAQCEACTALKTQVEQKFAQLDVLQGDPLVSDALIQKTQAGCQSSPVKRLNLWWVSLAACLAFAGLVSVVTINRSGKIDEPGPERVQNRVADAPALTPPTETPEMLAMDTAAPTMVAQHRPDSDPEPDPFSRTPFAPASAIELVTLPTRDNVQITIYNEADLTLVSEQRKLTLKRGWNWLQF
ncbi:MAG: hypothetical protein GY809_08695, partial [Planctomycetes bacterium]|nr:hypothetical protein [Planctomycetota bacterium]